MQDKIESIWDCCDEVSAEYDADIYFYSGEIDNEGFGGLVQRVAKGAEHENCLLIMVTTGGLANSAYQIARLLQKTYTKFILFTPSYCKSAGTMVALGAHQLIMHDVSELGPLDVQLLNKDELAGRRSGLVVRSAFESLAETSFDLFEMFMTRIIGQSRGNISFKTASEISGQVSASLMAEVYSQINPDAIGNDHRDLKVALEYGNRLAEKSKNPADDTVYKLVHNYPSHDFIIDDEEAKTLFENVTAPTPCLYKLLNQIGLVALQEASPTIVRRLRRPPADTAKEANNVERPDGTEAANDGQADEAVDDSGSPVGRGGEGEGEPQATPDAERDSAVAARPDHAGTPDTEAGTGG